MPNEVHCVMRVLCVCVYVFVCTLEWRPAVGIECLHCLLSILCTEVGFLPWCLQLLGPLWIVSLSQGPSISTPPWLGLQVDHHTLPASVWVLGAQTLVFVFYFIADIYQAIFPAWNCTVKNLLCVNYLN